MSIFDYREKPGYFRRLKDALAVTKEDLSARIEDVVGSGQSRLTEEQLDDLEAVLIQADLGVKTTMEIIDQIREETRGERFITSFQVRRLLRTELLKILAEDQSAAGPSSVEGPAVVFVVGVNGVGKTTTIGKLARLYSSQGKSVLLCASDTFRAAAVEQLEIWAERTDSDFVKQSAGADPAAVLYDAIAASRARNRDVVIVDTAGRLHTKRNLMEELDKMKRVAAREVDGAPHEVYLIVDATTGQNGLIQAREFMRSSGVTGVIVTKLDGTAKGGIVAAIRKDLEIPIRFVGVGEKLEDLIEFSPEAFVDGLLFEEGAQSSDRRVQAES